ncbi:MAG: hypothetical protein AUI42_01335 [Actinobacteria bacterium 13_1_40CM_2_65_8]|nr:MAG: hypothetical protein AUI42_01335 [Actinobacteria bacterium 13_1_40CM_2_65_8]
MTETLRYVRLVLAGIGPLYSVAVLAYSLLEGSSSICTGSGGTFRCTEVTYASTWGFGGSVAVGIVMILTMAPLLSGWLRNRIPSVVAAIALPIVLISFTSGLAAWTPAWVAILAAAIAGPPSAKGMPD